MYKKSSLNHDYQSVLLNSLNLFNKNIDCWNNFCWSIFFFITIIC